MNIYTLVKFLHVLLAIVAVGFNMTYAIWLTRAANQPNHWDFALHGIKTLDQRFANPGYGLLLLTGLTMVFVGNLPLTTFWIAAGLLLWLIVVVVGFGVYTPTLRRQIAVLEKEGAASPAFALLAQRGQVTGIALVVLVVVIVFLMVVKPSP